MLSTGVSIQGKDKKFVFISCKQSVDNDNKDVKSDVYKE